MLAPLTKIDGNDDNAAFRDGRRHGGIGRSVIARPGAAVQVENRGKRPRTLRLVDARLQGLASVLQVLDVLDFKLKVLPAPSVMLLPAPSTAFTLAWDIL